MRAAFFKLLVLPYSFLVWEGNAQAYHVYYRDGFETFGWLLEAKVANANYILSSEDKNQPQRFWTVASVDADGQDTPTVNVRLAARSSSYYRLLSPRLTP